MKNTLSLHEAVAVVLLTKQNKIATIEKIEKEIEERELFPLRKGNITLAKQIKLRTAIASSKYQHLFEFKEPNILTLK